MGRPSVMPGDPEPRRKLKRFQITTYNPKAKLAQFREVREVREAVSLLALGDVYPKPLTWFLAGPGRWRGFTGKTLRVEIVELEP